MFSSWLVFKKNSFKRKLFLPYFLITVLVAIIIVLWVSNLLKENVAYNLNDTLRHHQASINQEIESIEMRLRFYVQFMADVDRLSDEFSETKIGRSILVYAINFLRSNNMYPYIPKSSHLKPAYTELIKKGIMGLNSTSLIVQEGKAGRPALSIDCINPIGAEAGIGEAVIISYPLDQKFLDMLNARTGADISLIYNNKVILSTIKEPSTYNSSLKKVEGLPPNILGEGNPAHLMEWGAGELSQKALLFPLKVNYKNVGLIAVSLPLKEIFIVQKNIYSTAGIFAVIVLACISAIYALISRGLKVSPAELQAMVEGYNAEARTGASKEVGSLQNSFDKMSSNLQQMTEGMRRSNDEIMEWNNILEKKVEEQSSKLHEVQQQLNQAEKLSALGELVSGVAHEINNPLSTIIGFAQIMEMDTKNDQVKTDLNKIVHAAKRASKTVNNLLTYARKEEPSKRSIQINDLIAQAIELREYEWRVNNIEVELNLAPDISSTMVDANQIKQVLLNVLSNAEQATQDTGHKRIIRVASEECNGQIVIKISDNGIGIPRENLSKVFDPFFTTKEVGRGTGLGLSVSYGIIKEHGGTIYAKMDVGQGSTFIITLPVVKGGHVLSQESYEPETTDSSELMDKRVLVVDDEAEALNYLTRFLESVGSKIETATNGREALNKLRQGSFDLILCDIKMPVMDGKELYSKVSAEMPEVAKRMVFATGDLTCQETRQFIEGTKARFVSKPFDLLTIKKVLGDAIHHVN